MFSPRIAKLLIDDHLARIEPYIAELPAARIMHTATGVITSEILVVTLVRTRQGLSGCSYVRCCKAPPANALRALIKSSGELAIGVRMNPETIHASFHAEYALLGIKGLVAMAISAIDLALWDAICVANGGSLRQLLGRGGPLPKPYLALSSMDGADAAREAEEALDAGFAGVKFKAGRHDAAADLEALRAIRSAIGKEAAIMVDYNQKLSLQDAQSRLMDLERFQLEWIEEPLSTDRHREYAKLRARSCIPIQLGENLHTAEEVADCIAGADVISLDLGRIGGVTGWLSAEAEIEDRRALSNHAYCEVSAQLLAASRKAQWVEWGEQARPLLAYPPDIVAGEIRLPDVPGTGMAFDEPALSHWRVG